MYDKICDFQNLLKAHRVARLGKRCEKAVIYFELRLSENLSYISRALKNHTYKMGDYYSFMIHDPKKRLINALHYPDRVVQHCICDEVLAPVIDKILIYDNSACRTNKGTHFALNRLSSFFRDFYKIHGCNGYILKCDIKKFFDNIDHDLLKEKLRKVFDDRELLSLLFQIIDSYEKAPNKGLPLGNQTSQWFAIYYLNSLDRLIKEKLKIKYYSRYMDDFIIIHDDKEYLKYCLDIMRKYSRDELKLEFNSKTQIIPFKNGVNYLGFKFRITENGKIIRKVKKQTKNKFKKRLKFIKNEFVEDNMNIKEIKQVVCSYISHLKHGNCYWLLKRNLTNDI